MFENVDTTGKVWKLCLYFTRKHRTSYNLHKVRIGKKEKINKKSSKVHVALDSPCPIINFTKLIVYCATCTFRTPHTIAMKRRAPPNNLLCL